MQGTRVDLQIKQGAKFEYEFFVNDGAQPSPNPIDVTGRTYRAQVRQTAWAPLIAQFSFETLDQTASDTKGRVLMKLDSTVTAGIQPGFYQYDVFQQIPDEQPDILAYGTAEVVAAITR